MVDGKGAVRNPKSAIRNSFPNTRKSRAKSPGLRLRVGYGACYWAAWLYSRISRDLRRAALLGWMMPRLAALSSSLMASCNDA